MHTTNTKHRFLKTKLKQYNPFKNDCQMIKEQYHIIVVLNCDVCPALDILN
jgi:hypothetical protein